MCRPAQLRGEECHPAGGYRLQEAARVRMKEGSVLLPGIGYFYIPSDFSKSYFWMGTKGILISWNMQHLKGVGIQILTYRYGE